MVAEHCLQEVRFRLRPQEQQAESFSHSHVLSNTTIGVWPASIASILTDKGGSFLAFHHQDPDHVRSCADALVVCIALCRAETSTCRCAWQWHIKRFKRLLGSYRHWQLLSTDDFALSSGNQLDSGEIRCPRRQPNEGRLSVHLSAQCSSHHTCRCSHHGATSSKNAGRPFL